MLLENSSRQAAGVQTGVQSDHAQHHSPPAEPGERPGRFRLTAETDISCNEAKRPNADFLRRLVSVLAGVFGAIVGMLAPFLSQ